MTSKFTLLSDVHLRSSVDTVIAMAVYAGDKSVWVEEAVNSLVCQTYENHIIVIVIDGYVHDEILTQLLNVSRLLDNILLVRGDANRGLSACMNFVVNWSLSNVAGVKYFCRMDADDISAPQRIEKQVSFLETHPKISILGCGLFEVNEQGEIVGHRKLPQKHGEIIRYLPKRCSINHPTVAIRMNVFKRGFRYRENLMNTQDYFFWADLAAAGFKFANLSDELLKFRRVNDFYKRRGLSKSINEFKARFYTMKVLKRYSFGNILYAFVVLTMRLMPGRIVKLAYKLDRYLLNKKVVHD
ncbi:glycosyltransferase [Brumicola nitratireducens]|uniref:Glycosyltransferase n=1 Tax=Glaciecola nitratireducens (strain JCM 12485 / KCTC 12276 / FR1064) TaxID=1085623 RepID=G4QM12_GLANF|nr:glycosyltransferase [Glaciecola nitratireducens]AEP30583.1 glycosyltransferase [Glaciecola nitratireducens FR1064]